MTAGPLRERVGFYPRPLADDGMGNQQSSYLDEADFIVAANIKPKLGGEGVLADRLQGKKLVNITVRCSRATGLVTEAWMAKDERTGVTYNIRSIINPDQRKHYFEMLCEEGVAQ